MKKNVGTLDAYVRISFGLIGLGCAIAKMSCFSSRRKPWGLLLLSSMKVAAGITQFCPLLYSCGMSTRKEDMVEKALKKIIPNGFSLSNEAAGPSSSGRSQGQQTAYTYSQGSNSQQDTQGDTTRNRSPRPQRNPQSSTNGARHRDERQNRSSQEKNPEQ
ncbi:YgaP family membrane protein [Brevibacillus daliensis]|uniref:YgaP family membrane protein n=1 Tax=Brevibacillus daliensis TaxID=2892995 RepID=UPI001E5A3B56|nr:DUF2892 domain-containing protein [Brevibacillus daliensis]